MILINIKMQIRPEKMDEWLALADSYARDVNSEEGCLFFQFSRSLTDANEFIRIEGFTAHVVAGEHRVDDADALHGGEAGAKLRVAAAKRGPRIDVQMAGEVHHREQQVAELGFDLVGVRAGDFDAEFGGFFG